MNLIDVISQDANQLIRIPLDDGTTVELVLQYRPAIQRWSLNVTRGTFVLNGLNVTTFPNMLRTWRDLIPFGLACNSTDGGDPVYVDDFTSGRCALYILDQSDVEAIELDIAAA